MSVCRGVSIVSMKCQCDILRIRHCQASYLIKAHQTWLVDLIEVNDLFGYKFYFILFYSILFYFIPFFYFLFFSNEISITNAWRQKGYVLLVKPMRESNLITGFLNKHLRCWCVTIIYKDLAKLQYALFRGEDMFQWQLILLWINFNPSTDR